jgi:eukaryotic-like serine/threonine-protein kinase
MTLNTGTKLGSYEITGAIGAGGMGEVYRARDAKVGLSKSGYALKPR